MKLYTEEQLHELIYKYRKNLAEFSLNKPTAQNLIDELTPVTLPTDEEIEERYYKELEERKEVAKNFSGQVAGRHPDMFGHNEVHNMVRGYIECVRWMRDKIKGGNNE